jgi:hypothetical protein
MTWCLVKHRYFTLPLPSKLVLFAIHHLGDQIKDDEMCGTCSTHGSDEKCLHVVFIGKLEEKRPLGNSRHRWMGNSGMDLKVWTGLICFRIGTTGALL